MLPTRGEKASFVLLALAGLATLVCAAPAAGSERSYKGKFDTGGTVKFEVVRNSDGKRRVVDWRWVNLPITCDDGAHTSDGEFVRGSMRIEPRAFSRTYVAKPPREGQAVVSGAFPDGWDRAEGSFEVTGDVGRDWHGCDSGVARWSAKRLR